MTDPSDQSERLRFANELDRNFSVVASAGSGKTRAITDRVLQIARSQNAAEILPQLVVVTFTNRAADEMQQRTRQLILEQRLPVDVVNAFNRAFFGTIHAFCMKLLGSYGHYLGLPAPLELITDDEDLWQEFVQQQTRPLGESLGEENRSALFRLAQARDIMELARRAETVLSRPEKVGNCPGVDFSKVHAVRAKGTGLKNTDNSKTELLDWEKRYTDGWDFLRWPICSTATKDFVAEWKGAFSPLRKWVADAALCIAAEVQRDYRDFRIERGVVTYADQIALADELLRHPAAAQRIRGENLHVILDEGQDTDPVQFSVLLEITRPPDAAGRWLETKVAPPQPGHFCMVGDRQQSIFGNRADLRNYKVIHDSLVLTGAAEEITFPVTFRLDQEQVDFINRTFREILNDDNGQVRFVKLEPRPDVLPGQVIQIALGGDLLPPREKKRKDYEKAKIEAEFLARWIKDTGFEKLRAKSWSDVAILSPRKAWLRMMATELRRVELPIAVQSESTIKADSPAHAWLTALCTIMVDPLNGYEIAGVLREIFGTSDHDLATFADGEGSRFRIDHPASAVGVVSSRLRELAETRGKLEGKALFDAVRILIDETHLRERLISLPQEEFGDLLQELDSLQSITAEFEAQGATLADFAEKLRGDFEKPRDPRLLSEEGIQLITSHKAKGSEWQAVIVPFLGRDVRSPPPRYPSLIKIPASGEMLVALSKEDPPEELKKAREGSEQQEMQRLLYVATTRAKHTLVLALDRELFLDAKKKLSKRSQLKLLLGEPPDANAATLDSLTKTPLACPSTAKANSKSDLETEISAPLPGAVDKKTLQTATRRSAGFVRKIRPSDYREEIGDVMPSQQTEDALVTNIAKSTGDTPATLYGQWWHAFAQRLPWQDKNSWPKIFEETQRGSPAPKRSADEWRLFRQCLDANQDLSMLLTGKTSLAHPEMPFLWKISDSACLEGIVDLALFESDATRGFILDWKTNRIKADEIDGLKTKYRPQMCAYWHAISQITSVPVHAAIYSTATGELISYTTGELQDEWERLRNLPPANIEAALEAD